MTHLERISKCIPVLVEAGCPTFPDYIYAYQDAWCIRHQSGDSDATGDPYFVYSPVDDKAIIAVLKEWFAETVVPWFYSQHENSVVRLPWFCTLKQAFGWRVDVDMFVTSGASEGSDPDPTEAFVQCLEALCEVLKGGG